MNQKQSVNIPVWVAIALTTVVVAAVSSLIVVLVLGGDDGQSASQSMAPTTMASVDISASTELPTTSPVTTPATAPGPDEQLQILAQSLGTQTDYAVAEGDCPRTAAIVADQTLRLYEWRDTAWLETSFDLFDNSDTPVISTTSADYAPNSGHDSFLVTFDGPAIGGPIFGGILGQYECRWSLIDILVTDSIRKVVIGLSYSEEDGLTGYSTAGASTPDIRLSYDPHNVAYFAE